MARVVADAEDAVISTDLGGVIASWNRAAERLLGYTIDEAVGAELLLVDDAAADRLRRLRSGADALTQGRYRRKGGGTVEVCVTASLVRDDAGELLGAAMTVRDASALLSQPDRHSLPRTEMHHAIRNLFTLVSSVVSLSSRFAATPSDVARRVRGRLVALSHVNDLRITATASDHARARGEIGLHALIRAIVASHRADAGGARALLTIAGPDLPIPGSNVTSFALMLDELAGKAVQYGALSHPRGSITVETAIEPDALVLHWQEHGGALPGGAPLREGAGSGFIRTIATQHLGGSMTRRWVGDGLMVRLALPLRGLRP